MLSLPEIATKLVDETLSQANEENARTVVLAGSKEVGKSTLLCTFLERTETPRETLVLEYSFGRRSNQKQSIEKTICHIWEYGGKLEALKNVLTSIPVKGNYYFYIMVDLSKIKRVWETIETCIQAMHDTYAESEKKPEVVIVGGKYDIFKNYDSEIKKMLCTTIRSIAMIYKAHVLFYSSKEAGLVRRAKETLQNSAFGNGIVFKEKNSNFTKPLLIPVGSDSWESIGLKVRHLSRIPPEPVVPDSTATVGTQLSARTHPEPTLDKVAALKYEELRRMESLDVSIDEYLLNGKSTLLCTFLERTETPRETLVLEYSFGRRSNQKQSIEKTICHIWEYGGKLEALKNVLTSIPVKGNYYFYIMVDLSKIKRVWETIETCIQAMHDTYAESEKKTEIVIVGGKYDVFKNYDSEIKKILCTTIRSMAMIYKAHVLFYSSKEPALVRRAKETLQNSAFGNGIVFKEKNSNFTKPLLIPVGSDSWESIGLKVRHLSRIPPEPVVPDSTATGGTQLSARTHPEPTLDKVAALKYEELRRMESLDVSIDEYLLSVSNK
ncbi:Uncharacterized protein OBRU01_20374 [Operophtera brumata]|uniref:Cytoplasmic dynein 2 light intermediate chain 1 n=1 Tax=Operophtera brumata TaxID=104452 RepID=A0A0L7KV48_OPEBR|nr:Uncharacterized protein OBRU01_20374 [Operophtera brumata]